MSKKPSKKPATTSDDRCPYTSDGKHVYLLVNGGKERSKHCSICAANKPRLKDNLTGTKKLPGKKTEGEKRPDPIQSQQKNHVPSVGASDAGTLAPVSNGCLGFVPSLVNERCRCAVCRTKPHDERTKRPFVFGGVNDASSSTPAAQRTVESAPLPTESPPLVQKIEEEGEDSSDPTTTKPSKKRSSDGVTRGTASTDWPTSESGKIAAKFPAFDGSRGSKNGVLPRYAT